MTVTAGDFTAGKITVDNVTINGTTIGHTSDTDLMTLADGGLTVAGTITGVTSLTVDDMTLNGSTISDSGDFTIDSGGDITLDADGADWIFSDGGTTILGIHNVSSDAVLKANVNDKDMIFKGTDNNSEITALTLDMSEAGAATFNSGVTLGGNLSMMSNTVYANQLYVNDRVGHLNDASCFIDFDVDTIKFATASEAMRIDSSNNVGIGITTPNEGGFGATSSVLSIAGTAQDAFGVLELISTDVTASNRIGEIRFGNLDAGNSFASNAGMRATRAGADNSSALSLWTSDAGTFAERMHIGATGIAVGTSTLQPTVGDIGPTIKVSSDMSGTDVGIVLEADTGEYTLYSYNNEFKIMKTDSAWAERFNIHANGWFKFTSNTAYQQLQLSTNVGTSGYVYAEGNEVGFLDADGHWKYRATNGADHRWFVDNSTKGILNSSGVLTVTSVTETSDYRLKENISDMDNGALTRINALTPRKFIWKEGGKADEGFIAHELNAVEPNLVFGEKDGTEEVSEKGGGKSTVPSYQAVGYAKITTLLVKALQEADDKIDALEARIATLEG